MRNLIEFSEEEIRHRMEIDNPWWKSNKINDFYTEMDNRPYIDLFYPLLTQKDINRAIVLMGPRRVGKTVMIHHSIQNLIKEKVNPKDILYLSIDTPIYSGIGLEKLINISSSARNSGDLKFVFFDEVQYLKQWEVHLKSLIDTYKNTKFVASGSAAAALKMKSLESGAGRFTEFMLPPLTFYEYILLKKIKSKSKLKAREDGRFFTGNIQELNKHFIDYINYGGYPEVALSKAAQSDPGRFVKNDIIDKVLLKDLPGMYGIQDVQELNSLFSVICYNTGNEISLEQLSKNSGVAKNTIIKYLKYLEAAFLIKQYNRIDYTAKRFRRKTFFKLYLSNPSMRSATFFPIESSDPFFGNMVETAIFSQWVHSLHSNLFYARWEKGEIDIVNLVRMKPDWAVEIKWSDRYIEQVKELNQQLYFCSEHNLKEILVTTRSKEAEVIKDGVKIEFIPAAFYCYTVGRNLIKNRPVMESLKGDLEN